MYIPRPGFTNNASAAEIKRYLVMVAEVIEKELTKLEEKIENGNET